MQPGNEIMHFTFYAKYSKPLHTENATPFFSAKIRAGC